VDAERRGGTRRRTLKGACVVFNNGWGAIACVVRNVSETGALLQVASTIGIPTEFALVFDDGGSTQQCMVRWRSQTSLGVRFKAPGGVP
jgi:hypothetical protein